MKDKLGGKEITEFSTLRPKTYSYLTDMDENKKAKGKKSIAIKQKRENYKNCLEVNQLEK